MQVEIYEGLGQVQDEIAHAQRLGIRAVPTFVFDGRIAVQGAQPRSAFLRVLGEVQRQAQETATEEASAGACADGACAA